MLHGRAWNDLAPILALLDANARAVLTLDADAIADAPAPLVRRDRIHAVIDRLTALPLEIASQPLLVLRRWCKHRLYAFDAAGMIAA